MRLIKTNQFMAIFNRYLYDSLLHQNLTYYYNYGSLLGLFLVIQIITGVFLGMHYVSDINLAFDSIEYLMREVDYGWFIRYLHANGAAFFFIVVYLHISRALMYGSYLKSTTWIIGVLIFLIMIITAFLGYTLVYGQMSYWAATVITNLLTTIPYLGQPLVYLVWGSYTVSKATINRFYSLHYLLPFIITALVILHLMALHNQGGTNPLGVGRITTNFHPYYSYQDLFGVMLIMLPYMYYVLVWPNALNHPDNSIMADPLVTPAHIVPEFYLLPFYAILRAIDDKVMGVIAMLSSILILLTLPYTHSHLFVTSLFRPLYRWSLLSFFFIFLLLTYLGQADIAYPYTILNQSATVLYFMYFLCWPLISFIELLLFLL